MIEGCICPLPGDRFNGVLHCPVHDLHWTGPAAAPVLSMALAEFAVPFAQAVGKLRAASDAGHGVTLTDTEVKVMVDALRMLRTRIEMKERREG